MTEKISRKQQILQVLADILEKQPEVKVTTKLIATEVGVTEAALYRHFQSKSRMYSDLIDFIEETLLSLISRIEAEENSIVFKLEKILTVYLSFAEKNPGLSRLMTGEALAKEEDYRLVERMTKLSEKIEINLKQILRESQLEGLQLKQSAASIAKCLHATCEGLVLKYNRSNFKNPPLEDWQETWNNLQRAFF